MIYDDKQDKYFHEGEWLTAQEFINGFLEHIERNHREMDASPNKAFYDSVRVASGGVIIKDFSFEEEEFNEFGIMPRDFLDLLHATRRNEIIPEHERMQFESSLPRQGLDYFQGQVCSERLQEFKRLYLNHDFGCGVTVVAEFE